MKIHLARNLREYITYFSPHLLLHPSSLMLSERPILVCSARKPAAASYLTIVSFERYRLNTYNYKVTFKFYCYSKHLFSKKASPVLIDFQSKMDGCTFIGLN